MIQYNLRKPFHQPSFSNAYSFHKTLPNYQPTPLHNLGSLANNLGLQAVSVKDESQRFDLNAFKILGASWAVAVSLAEYYDLPLAEINYDELRSCRSKSQLTFVTATDGNHGRGVARAAAWFNHQAVVYLPDGASEQRVLAVQKEGARADVLDMNYDQAVRHAHEMAEKHNWILLQDTAFKGYKKIPQLIMEGYETIIYELKEQMANPPTHIILQAGVGSFAAAMIRGFAKCFDCRPQIIIVEPQQAACYYHSSLQQDNQPHAVEGPLDTIMAGLACGEPSVIAFEIINKQARAFFSVDDEIARRGMRILASPLNGDAAVVSGESGAVGIGLLHQLCTNEQYQSLRAELKLNKEASVLCISTEGATDSASYNSIVSA